MPQKPRTPGVQAYFDTLRHLFALESRVLSGTLPHYGERGANDELRVRQFLSRVLPKKVFRRNRVFSLLEPFVSAQCIDGQRHF
jgi:hypothetical protein